MKKAWYTLKLFYYIIKISGNPENTPLVLKIGETLLALNLTEQATATLRAQPEFQNLWNNKVSMKPVDLHALQKLPEKTLGRVYADHMLSRNLNPNFFNIIERDREVTYAIMRLRETHDLWHVLTGFDTTVPDELGLQAFMAAQTNSPLSPILIAGGLLRSGLRKPAVAREILSKVSAGWQMGTKAKSIFALDWESNWQTPIENLRADYNVQALN